VTQKGTDATIPVRYKDCFSGDVFRDSFNRVRTNGGRIDSHIIIEKRPLLQNQGSPCMYRKIIQIAHAMAYDAVNGMNFLIIPPCSRKFWPKKIKYTGDRITQVQNRSSSPVVNIIDQTIVMMIEIPASAVGNLSAEVGEGS
tara:strand:+ start:441 stop:866 length:426 start_codon:yes stop_codon:yes gene_type:complete